MNIKQSGVPFYLSINGQMGLEERLGEVQVVESLSEPFQINITLIPSETMPLQESFINAPVVLTFDPLKRNLWETGQFSFPKGKLTQYLGYVANERKIFVAEGKLGGVSLVVRHPLYWLRHGSHARIFSINTCRNIPNENTLEDIFTEVLAPYRESKFAKYGVNTVEFEEFPEKSLDYITQYQENDLHFLLRLCEVYGIGFTQQEDVLTFKSMKASYPVPYGIDSKSEVLWEYRTADHSRILESRDLSYTYPYGEPPDTVSTVGQEWGEDGLPFYQQRHYETIEEGEDLLATSASQLAHSEKKLHLWNTLTSINEALIGVRAGDNIFLPGTLPEDSFRVHKISWRYRGQELVGSQAIETNREGDRPNHTYFLDLHARESKVPFVPAPLHQKPKIAGYHRAIVISPETKDWADQDKSLGRIKVRFIWDKDPEQHLMDRPEYTCWVRLVTPFGGKNHGFYVMPEVGDEVLMGFEDGDIDRPVCLGSVYNIQSQYLTGMQPQQQMETAKLKTPKNLVLEFWEAEEEQNKKRIVLSANEKIVMTMNVDGQSIAYNLDSKGTVSVHAAGTITEDSDTKVVIKRGDAGSITIDKEGNMFLTAKGQMVLKGNPIHLNP